jgi:tripartite-type tricarboxylate transporter receptor subunit TctC
VALSNFKDAVQHWRVKSFIATLLIAVGLVNASTASAQNVAAQSMAYPIRSVRLFVPFPAGTVPDILIRAVTQPLSQTWGRAIVVENRAGANGNIGMDACAKSAPDGYTICLPTGVIMSLNPYAYARMPYDPLDLVPVVHIGTLDQAIAVNASVPVNTVRELVEYAKARPGTLSWGSLGMGSTAHLYMEWLHARTGASFVHVPYKGSNEVVYAVSSGELQVLTLTPSLVVPQMKSGKVKVLAVVSGKKRLAAMPEVPTLAEAGYELDFRNWIALYFPRGAPTEAVRAWNVEVNRIMADARFVEKFFLPQSVTPAGGTPDDLSAFARANRQTAAELAKIANLKFD